MKVDIVGASHFVNRMFEACGTFQWAREFLKNAIEAGATQVEFGIEWQAVERFGTYRRTVIDNGHGMSSDELLSFFSTLGHGAKKIGGLHDNFGVGAKIASLPWNPQGVVVISKKHDSVSMIWIVLDAETGEYELQDFEIDGGTTCVIDPTGLDWGSDIDWGEILPSWVGQHGTAVVLLGSEKYPDTVLGNPDAGESDTKGLSIYLNSRFWDLSALEVRVAELRSTKKNRWPQGPGDRDDARRPNNRRIQGARYYLEKLNASDGKLAASGTVTLDNGRVEAHWWLWDGERPSIHMYAPENGYIAVRYRDELFHQTNHKVHYRWFGVIDSQVQRKLTIVLEPQLYQTGEVLWGVHPDQSRNRLIFTGNGQKGVEIPLADWGFEFAEKLPDEIRDAIRVARGEMTGSIDNEEYRKRLQDKFGNRWRIKKLVADESGRSKRRSTPSDEDVEVPAIEHRERKGILSPRTRPRTIRVTRKHFDGEGNGFGVEREVPVDVPRYRFAGADEFERPWHLAMWAPHDPDGPTVVVNQDSPILSEVVEYHQEQYPDVYAEEVRTTVFEVFGEVAACKVAHAQKLTKEVTEQELDRDYRSEAALTVALMGLLAEEAVIGQRLKRLGRKRDTVTEGEDSGATVAAKAR